jgi:uncharacterized membrane protein
MWILSVLPDWVFHMILLIGALGLIAGIFLGVVPLVKTCRLSIQIVSLLLFSLGLYLEGGLADNAEWQARTKEMEVKVAQAEVKSEKVNVKVVTKVVKQLELVREKGDDVIKYIDREVVKYDNTCPVPAEVVTAVNAAALNMSAETNK